MTNADHFSVLSRLQYIRSLVRTYPMPDALPLPIPDPFVVGGRETIGDGAEVALG